MRDVILLRRVARLFSDDLRRDLGEQWGCSLDDEFVLTVTNGRDIKRVLVDSHVPRDDWPPEAWSDEYREGTLEDDASEALGEELAEVLRLWQVAWPVCPEHGVRLTVCSAVWVCDGRPTHDLALVGELPSR